MGDPIRVTMDTLQDVFTFSPFTTDDVVDGVVRADIMVLFMHGVQAGSVSSFLTITMHGLRYPMCLTPADVGNQFTHSGRSLLKGVPTRPMALREIAIHELEAGMLFATAIFRRAQLSFGIIESSMQLGHQWEVKYRERIDDITHSTLGNGEEKILVFVEAETMQYVLK